MVGLGSILCPCPLPPLTPTTQVLITFLVLYPVLSLVAMMGPFNMPPFSPWSQVSPLMTVEKKDSDARRVIIDLSFPAGLSVNAGVPKNFFQGSHRQYTLPTITDLADLVTDLGRGCLMWKADLERAYLQLQCHPLDYPLMGICHQGEYYTDICPSFGCRGSSMSQQCIPEAVSYLMGCEGHWVLAYVDNFCGAHASAVRPMLLLTLSPCLQTHWALSSQKRSLPLQQRPWSGWVFFFTRSV